MREVASHGRYFPIAAASLISSTKDWRLTEKMRLVFRNPGRSLAEAGVIARLRPGRDLVVFSLPIEVAQELGARAAARALSALARWKDDAGTSVEGCSRAIVVYMPSRTQLRIVEHRIKYSRGKFGAGEGLATSRKPRVTSKVETELAVLPI
jgi:hypothetical protein